MTASDDEYDIQAGGPIELTEQDCAAIDALSATPQDSPSSSNVPGIDIAVLAYKTRRRWPLRDSKKLTSPIERYRRKGRLSVSDLVSPAWCELQFEYGLLQRRSGSLDQRPTMFVSREGKEIRVKEKTAQLNEVVLQEGNAVHSALEREIHPTKVEVTTSTQEEYWGLRLFNMISDLQTLMLIGKCDEITRTPIVDDSMSAVPIKKRSRDYSAPSTPSKPNPKRTKADPSSPSKQLRIDSFFPITPWKTSRKEGSIDDIQAEGNLSIPGVQTLAERLSHRTHSLHLIDSKTRLSPSLPQHSATLSSRLQLMTYKRLLDALLTRAPAFDFRKLWKYLGVNPRSTFSDAFMEDLLLLSPVEEYGVRCLKDLEAHWWSTVRELGLSAGQQSAGSHAPVDPELTLVYRLRGAGPRAKGKEAERRPNPSSEYSEQVDLEKAILESLGVLTSDSGDAVVSVEMNDRANALEVHASNETQDVVLECTLPESQMAVKGESLQPEINGNTKSLVSNDPSCDDTQLHGEDAAAIPPINAGDIIGQKTFEHDDHMLDAHITNILTWWHGERAPRGVEIEEASRCHTCEYMDGCEWREKKAFEARGSDVAVDRQPE